MFSGNPGETTENVFTSSNISTPFSLRGDSGSWVLTPEGQLGGLLLSAESQCCVFNYFRNLSTTSPQTGQYCIRQKKKSGEGPPPPFGGLNQHRRLLSIGIPVMEHVDGREVYLTLDRPGNINRQWPRDR